MLVRELIQKLQAMPGDTEVYEHDGETGEYFPVTIRFVDIDSEDFEMARRYSYSSVAENEPYAITQPDGEPTPGVRLYQGDK